MGEIEDGEASTIGGADGSVGPSPARHPTGIAAWRALREPGGALYPRLDPEDPSVWRPLRSMARPGVHVHHVRTARHRSLS